MNSPIQDVAIVGAGVSGVYCAWRLLSSGKAQTVTLLDADDHIGGRLLSVRPPKIDQMVAELGGMRILPEVQPRIGKLIATLNDQADAADRIETFPFPVDDKDNLAYLRGVHLRLADFSANPQLVPYNLSYQEQRLGISGVVVNAIEQVVAGITNPKLTEAQRRQMTQQATFEGEPLYQMGFWEVLMRVMSSEAYQLAIAAGGYQTTLSNWNAADAIPWYLADFGIKPKYEGFKQGFQQVPLTIGRRVSDLGGVIRLNTRVTGFEWDGDVVTLRLANGEALPAKRLILAMPRRSLELLTPGSPLLQMSAAQQLIRSVTGRPLFKLFTTYERPWWLAAGVEQGRSVTDLPVRQTYYWPLANGQPCRSGCAMLMSSYDDSNNIDFWAGFRPRRGRGWRPTAEVGDDSTAYFSGSVAETGDDNPTWHRYQAPQTMVAEVQRQLAEIHGLRYLPQAVDASFRDWGDDPFGGGWNSWNIGVKSWEVKHAILQPQPGVPVHICGEAYSDAQGWVEGALQTADMLLQAHFELEPPTPV